MPRIAGVNDQPVELAAENFGQDLFLFVDVVFRVVNGGENVVRRGNALDALNGFVEIFAEGQDDRNDELRGAEIEFSVYESAAFSHAVNQVDVVQFLHRPRNGDAADSVILCKFDLARQFIAYFQNAVFDFSDNIVIYFCVKFFFHGRSPSARFEIMVSSFHKKSN